jgi:hypothetical protein
LRQTDAMGFLDRFFGDRDDGVPAWARVLTAPQFRVFCTVVEQELSRRGLPADLDGGTVVVTAADGSQKLLGLMNLAKSCAQWPGDDWTEIVGRHFEHALAVGGTEEVLADFSAARDQLKVKFYPADACRRRQDVISWPWSRGLAAVVVADLPTQVVTVPDTMLKAWGRERDEIVELAHENLRREPLHELKDLAWHPDATLRGAFADSFFTATHLLRIDEYVPQPPPLGVLATVPNRHALLLHEVRDASVLAVLEPLLVRSTELCLRGPGSLVSSLLWWRDGRWTEMHSAWNGCKVEFTPSPEFVRDVLERFRS